MSNKENAQKTQKAGDVVAEKDGIIYVVHPVTPERKNELMRKGKIIDARFYSEEGK